MKATKYFLIALVIVAVVAAAGWVARDTLIRRLSGPALKNYDVEIIDVSLDALATSQARIGRLELLHTAGTRIIIEGLSLPIATSGEQPKKYRAEKVSIITATRDEDAPLDFFRLINQLLSLNNELAVSEFEVGEFSFAPFPVVREIRWLFNSSSQELTATVESIPVTLSTKMLDAATYHVAFSLPNVVDDGADTLIGELTLTTEGIELTGQGVLQLPAWEAVAKLAGIVPDPVRLKSGKAELSLLVEFPADPNLPASLDSTLTQVTPWHIDYQDETGDPIGLLVSNSSQTRIIATFPALEWTVRMAQASLLVTRGEWKAIPVSLGTLSCQTGPRCSMNADISWAEAELPGGSAGRIDASAMLNVSFPENGIRVDIVPDASLSVTEFLTSATGMTLFEARMVSGGDLELLDNGWQFRSASIDTRIESMTAGSDIFVTAPAYLESLQVSDLDEKLAATFGVYVPSINTVLAQQTIALPGIRGTVSMNDADLYSTLDTVGLQDDGALTLRHNIVTGDGSINIEHAVVSFGSQKLSKRVSPWRHNWDLIAGLVDLNGRINWSETGDEVLLDGKGSFKVNNAAGFYTETAFTGLSTTLSVTYAPATGFTSAPSVITVALVDMGLPVESLTADYTLDLNSLSADIANLQMTAFGGSVRVDPFSFHTDSDSNNLTLHAEKIQLSEILSLKEFEAVSVTGSVSATLPVTIEQDQVTITGGRLLGDTPGGVIRYRVANGPDATSASSIDLVTRALSNFVYETLTSDVDYNEGGDLILKMQLKGRNPDMEGNRPVILNLSVENNVPQMLRSLQAARAVEDVLEKRVKK